jgi:hypothetical protein
MARNTKNRLKKRQQKAAKRKQKRRAIVRRRTLSKAPSLSQTENWPFYEILLTENWQEPGTLVQILIVRRGPAGQYAVGGVLVDLACLGVKIGYGSITDRSGYLSVHNKLTQHQKLVPADANLVAKIIREGVAYAKSLGFRPDPDYRDVMAILGDVDPDACDTSVPLGGVDGKPLFIAGPHDNVDLIIKKLTRAVGPDGFHFLMPLEPPPGFDDDW